PGPGCGTGGSAPRPQGAERQPFVPTPPVADQAGTRHPRELRKPYHLTFRGRPRRLGAVGAFSSARVQPIFCNCLALRSEVVTIPPLGDRRRIANVTPFRQTSLRADSIHRARRKSALSVEHWYRLAVNPRPSGLPSTGWCSSRATGTCSNTR